VAVVFILEVQEAVVRAKILLNIQGQAPPEQTD
jgi:hypothetical protein